MDIKSKVTAMHSPTTFSLIKKQLDQSPVRKFIKVHHSDKHSKGFDTYKHLLVMIYAQLKGLKSLRELTLTLNSHHQQHYHLGLSTITRSTLSYANQHRSIEVFDALLQTMIHRLGRKQKKEIKDLVFLLDSTPIKLKGHGFDEWTEKQKTNRTQGLKLHIEYEPENAAMTFAKLTPANVNDICVAKKLPLRKNATYVFDKGYCDYDWWLKIDQSDSRFVTRLKSNAAIKVIETRIIDDEALASNIIEDAICIFTNKNPRAGKKLHYVKKLRRITIKRANKDAPLILVTNDLARNALEIGALYKSRWLIELFFKWIKQNLEIKRFMGRNENAVKIQIITALIAYALIVELHKLLPFYKTIREILLIIKTRLHDKVSFEKPPPMQMPKHIAAQLSLRLTMC
jgi:putative transposase